MNKNCKKRNRSWRQLINIMSLLRSDNGCPWDKKQTHKTLIPYLREETNELINAIKHNKKEHIKEELGDVLLQIIFHAQIAKENKWFDITDVIDTLTTKLKRRHPHVFGNKKIRTITELIRNWDKIKKQEKKLTNSG